MTTNTKKYTKTPEVIGQGRGGEEASSEWSGAHPEIQQNHKGNRRHIMREDNAETKLHPGNDICLLYATRIQAFRLQTENLYELPEDRAIEGEM
jgi:hypothetical protein